jgi:hypothetical protein
MPGPVVTKSFARLPNDLIVAAGLDTEIFRFPTILDAGSRVIRLCVSGGLLGPVESQSITSLTLLKTLGLTKPTPFFYNTFNPVTSLYATGNVRFVGEEPGRRLPRSVYIHGDPPPPPYPPAYISNQPVADSRGEATANVRCESIGEIGNRPSGQAFFYSYPPSQGTEFIYVYGAAEPPGITGGEGPPPLTVTPYSASSPTEFVAMVNGGQRDIVVLMNPSFQIQLCGVNGVAPDYAWQVTLEDLGPST